MKHVLLIFTIVLYCLTATGDEGYLKKREKDTEALTAYVNYFLRSVNSKRREKAKEFIPTVVSVSHAYNFDPLLIGTLIRLESAWQPQVIGKRSEVGLMQVGKTAIRRYKRDMDKHADIRDGHDQIRIGVHWLDVCRQKCGEGKRDDTLRYLSCYGTRGGRCHGYKDNPRLFRIFNRRYRLYLNAVSRFRQDSRGVE